MRSLRLLALAAFAGLALAVAATVPGPLLSRAHAQTAPLPKVTILLDWFVNPDHAALVIAREKGFFTDAGVDVELIAPSDPNDPPKLVAAGKADLAVSYEPQLHLQVAQGLPVVRVGTLIATPLNSLVSLKNGPITAIKDLKGRKIGISVGGFEDALLGTMLEQAGLSLDDVTLINVNFSLSPSLYAGQVDAVIGAFRNFELNQMDIDGKPGRAFFPEEHGVPAYDELILEANRDHLDNPALPRVLAGIERATNYIVNHPDDAWKTFIKAYPDLNDDLNKRAWSDTLPRMALRPAALDEGRYKRFALYLEKRGLIDTVPAVDSYAVALP